MCPVECLDCRLPVSSGGYAQELGLITCHQLQHSVGLLLDYLSKFYGKHKRLKHRRAGGSGKAGLQLMPDLQPGWGPRR